MTAAGSFEVVYRPLETRVYLYSKDGQPLSARGVQGQLAMRIQGRQQVFRFPLKHVARPGGSTGQDYLAAAVDVSRVRDGQMTVTVELTNLPNPQHPQTVFTQMFALSKLPVRVVPLDQSDPPRIERQQVCAVSGGRLGSMGTPIKVLVGDEPVYLCCRGCLGKLQKDPEAYLRKVAGAARAAGGNQPIRLVVSAATAADQAAVQAQKRCPVMNTALGAHGAPMKITIGDQSLFVCCRGCVAKVQRRPDFYLQKASELRASQ